MISEQAPHVRPGRRPGQNEQAILVIALVARQIIGQGRHGASNGVCHHPNVITNRYGHAMTTAPRDALDRLVAALEAHFEAASRRTGEADPAVSAAYQTLGDAFEVYDDALYDTYDEVTPFVLVDDVEEDDEDDEDDDLDEDDLDDLEDDDLDDDLDDADEDEDDEEDAAVVDLGKAVAARLQGNARP